MHFLGETFALSAALSWAVAVIYFKKSGDRFSPATLNIFKNAVGVVLFIPTICAVGEKLIPDQPLKAWLLLSLSGIMGIAVADTMFFMALKRLGAGLTAVVDTSYTPVMLLMSFVFLGERIGAGILAGGSMIVAALVIGSFTPPPPGKSRSEILIGITLGFFAIVIMGFSVVIIKNILSDAPYIWATLVRTLSAELFLLFFFLVPRARKQILAEIKPSKAWKYSVPASFFGTYLAMAAWIGGMKYTQVSVASLLNQLSTVFIFILATIVLKEPLTKRKITAIALAFVGAILVVLR